MANCPNPNCQTEYTPDPEQRYCDACGANLAEGSAVAPSAEGVRERAGPAVEGVGAAGGRDAVSAAAAPPESAQASTPEPSAAPAGNVRNVVAGEHNVTAGQNVNIRHEIAQEFCAAGAERIFEGRATFRCPECQRSPVCDRHFDEGRKLCHTCIEKQSVPCSVCGERVAPDQTFECSRCRRVVGNDHLDPARDWCTDCSAQWAGVIESIEKDEVVISTDGTVTAKDEVRLVDGVLKTKDGTAVATIKENIWYARPKQWYRIKPNMLRREQQAMGRFYSSMKLASTTQEDLFWQGPVTTWSGEEYKVRLQYPSSFPYRPPKAYVVSPKIEKSRHIYEDGHLCLFHKDDKSWEPGTTAATVMSWVSLWLHCYEAWKDTGTWPRPEHDQLVVATNY